MKKSFKTRRASALWYWHSCGDRQGTQAPPSRQGSQTCPARLDLPGAPGLPPAYLWGSTGYTSSSVSPRQPDRGGGGPVFPSSFSAPPVSCPVRSGVGSPVVGDCDGDYHYDSHKRHLQWSLPFIDASNKSGSLEFTMHGGHPHDFFPVTVTFTSKKPYCDIQVSPTACILVVVMVCIFLCFVHFVVPVGISPMGNSGRSPQGKPAATESRYPTLTD